MGEKPSDFGTQSGSAKSALVGQIVRLVRKGGLDYEAWRYVSKRVRQACELQPAKKGRKLPRVLNADDFRKFYEAVDKADDVQHALMMRLLFFTGVRVSELCNMQVADVDPSQLFEFSDPAKPPVVNGKIKKMLTQTEHYILTVLEKAGPLGLSKAELDKQSDHPDARKSLKNLAKDPDWREVILFPEQKCRGGYRLRFS